MQLLTLCLKGLYIIFHHFNSYIWPVCLMCLRGPAEGRGDGYEAFGANHRCPPNNCSQAGKLQSRCCSEQRSQIKFWERNSNCEMNLICYLNKFLKKSNFCLSSSPPLQPPQRWVWASLTSSTQWTRRWSFCPESWPLTTRLRFSASSPRERSSLPRASRLSHPNWKNLLYLEQLAWY